MDDIEDSIVAEHRKAMGYLLAGAHHLFRARMAASIADEPVHMGQVVLLASLYARNDLTQTQLVQVSGIEKSSVVLFLDALERDGWVERRRHPTDRRAHLVHLTDDGRARFVRVGIKLDGAQREALAVFTAEEQASLSGLLTRLMAHLKG